MPATRISVRKILDVLRLTSTQSICLPLSPPAWSSPRVTVSHYLRRFRATSLSSPLRAGFHPSISLPVTEDCCS